MRRSEEKMR
jgi:hypothetical protein